MVNMVRDGVDALQRRGMLRVETMRYGCIVWLYDSGVCSERLNVFRIRDVLIEGSLVWKFGVCLSFEE